MSFAHLDAAWIATTDSPVSKLLLVALADHADANGRCFPSIARLVARTELSRTAVITAIRHLEEGGFITVERANGHGSKYVVNQCATRTGTPPAPVQDTHPTGTPDAPPPVRQTHRTGTPPAPVTIKNRQGTTKEPLGQSPEAPAGAFALSGESERKPRAKTPRQPDLLFETLALLDGGSCEMTPTAKRAVAVALSGIRKATPGVTPDEIQRRSGNLRSHFPNAPMTASSLAKHWARCGAPPNPAQSNGRPVGKIADIETELRKLEKVCRESDLEAQRPENQQHLKELRAQLSTLRGEAKP